MKNTKAIPHPYHSVVAYLSMKDAAKAIDFYTKAFGAKEIGRIMMGDKIGHAELQIGDSRIMIAEEIPEWGNKGPKTIGGSPVSICFYTDDVDTVYKKALEAGATVDKGMEVKDQFYGDRSGSLVDPFGHKWVIATHIEDVSYPEMQKRMDAMMKEQPRH